VAIIAILSIFFFGKPAVLITFLIFLAPALMAISAYKFLKLVTTNSWLRVSASMLYAISPVAIASVNTGRLGTLVLLILLPWVVASISSLDNFEKISWRRIFCVAILLSIATSFTLMVWLAVLVVTVVGVGLDVRSFNVDLNKEIFDQVVSKVSDQQVLADLDATVAWAGQNGGDGKRLGITGFCWGGRVVWLYVAHNKHVKAGVAWYGRLAGPVSAMTPKHPLDVVAQINAPVLGLYGGADAGIPLTSVDQMNAALKAQAKPSGIHVYPDAPHAFHADYRPSYRRSEAEDGWRRATEWFKKHGV
jgi:dienelactone hydrolase